ncbi:hypothetical protein Pelo_3839, partial [Pelomyxa schiedti]
MEAQIASSNQQNESLSQQLADKTHHLESALRDWENEKDKVNNLTRDLNKKEEDHLSTCEILKRVSSEQQETTAQLKDAELTSRNLELALKDIEGKKSLLEEASAKLQQESDRLKQLLSDTTSERDNFRDDARKAAEQLAIAKEENISLNGQITLAQGDVEALKREKEELHKQHDQDAAERARISAELEEVHSKSKLIEAELAEKN